MSKIKTQYHYFYKITNLVNNHFYYGVHNTNNLDDGYMGSGKRLHMAYQKYGIENFKKEILKFFDTQKEAFEYEYEMVNENLISDNNCYNLMPGGKGGWEYINKQYKYVKDKDGNKFTVKSDDPRLLSGELVHHDKNVSKEYNKNHIIVKDKNNNYFRIMLTDERYLNGELVGCAKNMLTVKDKFGNTLQVSKYDERYLNGELKPIWFNRKHSDITKQKMHLTHIKNNHQQGEKNSQFGTCWIHNDLENKKIKKSELENYINMGWIKGRKMKF